MTVEWFSDLVICIFGLAATLVVIVMAVLAVMCYVRIRPVIDSLKSTTKTVENISSCVETEVVRPLAQVAAFVQGIRQAASLFGQFRKNREEK